MIIANRNKFTHETKPLPIEKASIIWTKQVPHMQGAGKRKHLVQVGDPDPNRDSLDVWEKIPASQEGPLTFVAVIGVSWRGFNLGRRPFFHLTLYYLTYCQLPSIDNSPDIYKFG